MYLRGRRFAQTTHRAEAPQQSRASRQAGVVRAQLYFAGHATGGVGKALWIETTSSSVPRNVGDGVIPTGAKRTYVKPEAISGRCVQTLHAWSHLCFPLRQSTRIAAVLTIAFFFWRT